MRTLLALALAGALWSCDASAQDKAQAAYTATVKIDDV
jgi:hypothetical protein